MPSIRRVSPGLFYIEQTYMNAADTELMVNIIDMELHIKPKTMKGCVAGIVIEDYNLYITATPDFVKFPISCLVTNEILTDKQKQLDSLIRDEYKYLLDCQADKILLED